MLREMLIAKIHRARVTDTLLHYEGSLGVDARIMQAAGLLPGQKVLVVNNDTGARFETYLIKRPAGSRKIEVLGAAARLAQPGDVVIIMAFGLYSEADLKGYAPRQVLLDQHNRLRAKPATHRRKARR